MVPAKWGAGATSKMTNSQEAASHSDPPTSQHQKEASGPRRNNPTMLPTSTQLPPGQGWEGGGGRQQGTREVHCLGRT